MKPSTKTILVGLLTVLLFMTLNRIGVIDYENAPIWVALIVIATVFIFPFIIGLLLTKESISNSPNQ